MSNKYLDKDVDYNISAEETGAGKFNRDKESQYLNGIRSLLVQSKRKH